jgi:hypothetical protein
VDAIRKSKFLDFLKYNKNTTQHNTATIQIQQTKNEKSVSLKKLKQKSVSEKMRTKDESLSRAHFLSPASSTWRAGVGRCASSARTTEACPPDAATISGEAPRTERRKGEGRGRGERSDGKARGETKEKGHAE